MVIMAVPITKRDPITALAVPAILLNRLKHLPMQFGKIKPPVKNSKKEGITMVAILNGMNKVMSNIPQLINTLPEVLNNNI